MGELAFRLDLDKEEILLAKLIGLLHDIGRFPQWQKYKTFSDSESVDHADMGVEYLFKDGHIREYIEDSKYDNIIEKAIKYHNKFSEDLKKEEFSEKEMLFVKMIRDMDKVDIYKQAAVTYNLVFDANELSEEVLAEFKKEKEIRYSLVKKRKNSDKVVIWLAFIFDINFNESFDILVETDNFDLFLSTIDVKEDSENLFRKLKEICFDKINRGVE